MRAGWRCGKGIARAIDQGSRLSAVRLATHHAGCDLLGLEAFNEEDLYANLAWLSEQQRRIELRLFEALHPEKKPALFLYDMTSSYLEGTKNEMGAFGYNRDGKRAKMQIVLGLLCDQSGTPPIDRSLCRQYGRSQNGGCPDSKSSEPIWGW